MRYPTSVTALALIATVAVAAGLQKEFTPQQRKWWAFQKVVKPAAPATKNPQWVRNDLDAFVLAKLEEKGLHPAPPAMRRNERRLHILPPLS